VADEVREEHHRAAEERDDHHLATAEVALDLSRKAAHTSGELSLSDEDAFHFAAPRRWNRT
jgi:hypothetical protein